MKGLVFMFSQDDKLSLSVPTGLISLLKLLAKKKGITVTQLLRPKLEVWMSELKKDLEHE